MPHQRPDFPASPASWLVELDGTGVRGSHPGGQRQAGEGGLARAKSRLRRVLNARFMRWWLLKQAVTALPWLGRKLAFYPRGIDMMAAADEVLQDHTAPLPADLLRPDLAFLERCLVHDSHAPGVTLPEGVLAGARTVRIRGAEIDIASGAVHLPRAGHTVMMRGTVANWNAARPRWRPRRVVLAGTALCPAPTANYYHLLVETGLRLLELGDLPALAADPPVLLRRPPGSAVEAALYAGLAQLRPEMAQQVVAPGTLVQPEAVLCHFPAETQYEWAAMDRDAAMRLRRLFETTYGALPPGGGVRLYLSRAGAKLRAPVNGAELDALLEAHGFETLVASDANHPDQIARFSAAEVIVAVHGAGLANLLFAPEGARVIEIFPGNFVKSTYWWMARRLGLQYRAVIGGPGDYDQRFEAPLADLEVILAAEA
ncbi:MAG: glycosyltransferase family 61 protein [Pseudomonadota bacterium]